MVTWRVMLATSVTSLMLAGAAIAQTTTGSPATGMDTSKVEAPKAKSRKGSMASAMSGDEKVKAAQQALKDKGHDPGSVDGRMGPKTQAALRDFQKAQGMEGTGRLDAKTMQSLGIEAAKTSATGESSMSGSASPSTTDEEKK